MGMVLLDLTFRVERSFGIRFPRDWQNELGLRWDGEQSDITLGEYHAYILRLCEQQRVPVHPQSWIILTRAVEDAACLRPDKITSETKLIQDIAPGG